MAWASWNYVAWGALHGFYQVIGNIKNDFLKKRNINCKESFSSKLGKGLVTFALVDFAWLFFRANSLKSAFEMIERIFTRFNPWVLFDKSLYTRGLNENEFKVLIFAIIVLMLIDLVKRITNKTIEVWLSEQQIWFRWTVIFVLLFTSILFGVYGEGYDASQFIYFQF